MEELPQQSNERKYEGKYRSQLLEDYLKAEFLLKLEKISCVHGLNVYEKSTAVSSQQIVEIHLSTKSVSEPSCM